MKKENLKIIGIAKGVKYSLVVTKDFDFNYIYLSIQHNKHIKPSPKVLLLCKTEKFSNFIKRIKADILSPTVPVLGVVATLNCDSFCEILKLTKLQLGKYEASMYYNYRRPKTKKYADSIALTSVDLETLINSLECVL